MTSHQLITRIRAGMPGDRDGVVVVLVHRYHTKTKKVDLGTSALICVVTALMIL